MTKKCKWCGLKLEDSKQEGYHNGCFRAKQLSVIPERKP